MPRKWISFRELYDDPNEPDDRGVALSEVEFETLDDKTYVTLLVTDKPAGP